MGKWCKIAYYLDMFLMFSSSILLKNFIRSANGDWYYILSPYNIVLAIMGIVSFYVCYTNPYAVELRAKFKKKNKKD